MKSKHHNYHTTKETSTAFEEGWQIGFKQGKEEVIEEIRPVLKSMLVYRCEDGTYNYNVKQAIKYLDKLSIKIKHA